MPMTSVSGWLRSENAKLFGVTRKRGPAPRLSLREEMTILIRIRQSHYRDFKAFYTQHVCEHMRSVFPTLVSYTRFVELIPSALPAMCLYLRVRIGQGTGVAFIDATPLSVYAPTGASTATESLPRRTHAGQEQYGMVLWLQAPSDCQ